MKINNMRSERFEKSRERGRMKYSGTYGKGPCEIGTTSQQKTLVSTPCLKSLLLHIRLSFE